MKKIKLKMGIASAVITAVVLVCVIIFNAIFAVVTDKFPLKMDLTKDKVYEFSQQTKDVMKNLKSEVTAYALLPSSAQGEYIDYIKEYLDKYKALNKKFKVKYIDPYEDPAFMQKYNDGDNQAQAGSVIVESGEKFKVVTFDQLYTQNSYTGSVEIDMERKVTNAVMDISGETSGQKVYFTTGHDEYETRSFSSFLNDEGYKTENVNIAVNGIPDDASIIYTVVPRADFTAEERDALDKFMDKGGKYVLVATPGMQPMERLDAYLDEWGIKLNYDYVIEADEGHALASGNGLPVAAPIPGTHTITEKLQSSKSPVVMPESMSFTLKKNANSAVTSSLLNTSEKSYGKTNLSSATIEKSEEDIDGPLSVAAISEKSGDKPSSVVVFGSLTAIEAQGILSEGAYLNGDIVLNIMHYLSGSSEGSGMRAKQISAEVMTMTPQQVNISVLLLQYVLPLIIVLIGLAVWLKRRNR